MRAILMFALSSLWAAEASQTIPPEGFQPKCPHEAGWHYLLDYGDDRNKNDIPDSAAEVAAGFSNANAYFVGQEYLETLEATEVSMCALSSYDNCQGVCTTLDENTQFPCVCDPASGLASTEAKVAMMLSGGCGALSTSCGKDKPMMYFTEHTESSGQSGWTKATDNNQRNLASREDVSWHVWNGGISLAISGATYQFNCFGNHNVEFGWHCNLNGKRDVNVFQVRVKLRPPTTTTATTTTATETTTTTAMILVDGCKGRGVVAIFLVLVASIVW